MTFFQRSKAQGELLKLTSEVLSASDDLKGSMEKLQGLKDALEDIKDKKTPKFTDNEWNDLASTYREAAQEIEKAPLTTDFDKKKYAVSIDELKNCDLKEQTLRKLNDYLQELKNAQERGKQSIITTNGVSAKIKISRELLRYCIDVHEKLGQLPIFGEKFLWDWIALQTDVTDALNIFEEAIKNQKKKIIEEKSKLDLYIPNFEANLFHITKYLNENCRQSTAQKKPATDNKKVEEETSTHKTESNVKENEASGNSFYIFLTTTIQSSKTFYAISTPLLHDGSLKDDMQNEKHQFISDMQKQFAKDPKLLGKISDIEIEVHYGKPYSPQILKTNAEVYDAIEAYKQSLRDAVDGLGADPIEFLQINHY